VCVCVYIYYIHIHLHLPMYNNFMYNIHVYDVYIIIYINYKNKLLLSLSLSLFLYLSFLQTVYESFKADFDIRACHGPIIRQFQFRYVMSYTRAYNSDVFFSLRYLYDRYLLICLDCIRGILHIIILFR